MGENSEIIENKSTRPQNANLTPGGPGRPKGSRNRRTIQWEALRKIADSRNTTPEKIEEMILEVGLLKAMKGDYNFYRDYMDREYGKVTDKTDITSGGKPIMTKDVSKMSKEEIDEYLRQKLSNTP